MADYRVGPNGDGVVSGASGAAAVAGVGSAFLTQFQAGDNLVFIVSDSVQHLYTVLSVTTDTALILTANMTQAYTSLAYYGLRDADELVTFHDEGILPMSVPAVGAERVQVGSGGQFWRGYARATWQWAGMTVAQLQAAKDYILAGAESGSCYVRTRDQADVWSVYQAILSFPDSSQLERWGGVYQGVTLDFILIEAVI